MTAGSPAATPTALAGLAIHHVQISVRDADVLAEWYVSTLGFHITKRVTKDNIRIVWIDIAGFRLGLAQIQGSIRGPDQSVAPPGDGLHQGYRQIHFSVANVDKAYNLLVSKGVKFAIPPTSHAITGIRLATMRDPEGNVLSLYEDLDPANPPVGHPTPNFLETKSD
jgi:catechol 2,3-dioxygenase-like lactoylglutathione lyase family enzyme